MVKQINLSNYYLRKSEIDRLFGITNSNSDSDTIEALKDIIDGKSTVSYTQTGTGTVEIGKININGTEIAIKQRDNNTTYTKAENTPPADTTNGTVGKVNKYALEDHAHPKSDLYAEAGHNHDGTYLKSYTPPDGSTSQKGIVQLNTSTNSTSTSTAATPSAVKSAYDLANEKPSLGTTSTTAAKGNHTHSNYIQTSAIKNDLETGGETNVLSAEQGKTLKSMIEDITYTDNETATDHNHNNIYYTESEVNDLLKEKQENLEKNNPNITNGSYDNGNLNEEPFTTQGWYKLNCSTANTFDNLPSALKDIAGIYCKLEVKVYLNYITQTLYVMKKVTNDTYPRIFYRQKGGATNTNTNQTYWNTDWKEIADTDTYLSKTDALSTYQSKIISEATSQNVVTNENGEITTEPKPTIPTGSSTATDIKMNGTQSAGTSSQFAKANHVHPTDTTRAPATHVTNDKGTSTAFGHVKVSDNISESAGDASESVAASSKAVKDVYDIANPLKERYDGINFAASGTVTKQYFRLCRIQYSNDTTSSNVHLNFEIFDKRRGDDYFHFDINGRYTYSNSTTVATNVKVNTIDCLDSSNLNKIYFCRYNEVKNSYIDVYFRIDTIEAWHLSILDDHATGGSYELFYPVKDSRESYAFTNLDSYETDLNNAGKTINEDSSFVYTEIKQGEYNLTVNKISVDNGTSNQFLKADGSLDNNSYLTTSDASSTYLTNTTGSVTSTNIADKTIVNGDIADGTIESGKIKDGTIVNGDIANTTIQGGKLVSGTITATQLASNAVETAKIANSGVTLAKLNSDVYESTPTNGSSKLITSDGVYDAIQSIQNSIANIELIEIVQSLPTSNISTKKLYFKRNTSSESENLYDIYAYVNNNWEHIDALNIDISEYLKKADLGAGTGLSKNGTTLSISNSGVTATQLASNAVEEAKIKNGAVTTDKIGASAVTSAKIADGTIVNGDIASNAAITYSKLSGVAPTSHASTATTYGVATTANYGHTKVVQNLTTNDGNGLALGAGQGKALKTAIDEKSTVSVSPTKTSGIEIGKITVDGTTKTLYQQDNNTIYTASINEDLIFFLGAILWTDNEDIVWTTSGSPTVTYENNIRTINNGTSSTVNIYSNNSQRYTENWVCEFDVTASTSDNNAVRFYTTSGSQVNFTTLGVSVGSHIMITCIENVVKIYVDDIYKWTKTFTTTTGYLAGFQIPANQSLSFSNYIIYEV